VISSTRKVAVALYVMIEACFMTSAKTVSTANALSCYLLFTLLARSTVNALLRGLSPMCTTLSLQKVTLLCCLLLLLFVCGLYDVKDPPTPSRGAPECHARMLKRFSLRIWQFTDQLDDHWSFTGVGSRAQVCDTWSTDGTLCVKHLLPAHVCRRYGSAYRFQFPPQGGI